jgi:hypothetical protein
MGVHYKSERWEHVTVATNIAMNLAEFGRVGKTGTSWAARSFSASMAAAPGAGRQAGSDPSPPPWHTRTDTTPSVPGCSQSQGSKPSSFSSTPARLLGKYSWAERGELSEPRINPI